MNILDLSEQEIIRRNSLDEMRKLGIEPFCLIITTFIMQITKIT